MKKILLCKHDITHKYKVIFEVKHSFIPEDSPVLTCVCALTLFFADDMWSQRTVIKWSESGAGSQSVSSALLVSHCQTGSKCRGLSSEAQQTCFLCSRSRVSISLQQVKWRRYKIRSANLCGHTILLFIPFLFPQGSSWCPSNLVGTGPVRWGVEETGWR